MTTQTKALNIAIDYMNERLEDHDCKYQRHPATEAERINILADIETVKEALAQPEQERCVGCEACIDTACGRDECPKGWPKAAQPEQEPVACVVPHGATMRLEWASVDAAHNAKIGPLYTTPPQRKPLTDERKAFKQYIDECDKFAIVPDAAGAFHAAWQAAHGTKE